MTRDDDPFYLPTSRQRECLCGYNPDCTNEQCPRLGVGRWLSRLWRKVRRG